MTKVQQDIAGVLRREYRVLDKELDKAIKHNSEDEPDLDYNRDAISGARDEVVDIACKCARLFFGADHYQRNQWFKRCGLPGFIVDQPRKGTNNGL